ncbi:MAG: sulfatase, partial [Promethearchaeota archaeon]
MKLNNREYFSFNTKYPVLGWEEKNNKLEFVKLYLGKNYLQFNTSNERDLEWKLKKGFVEITKFRTTGRKNVNVLPLRENESFEKNLFLPEGKFILKIWAESENSKLCVAKIYLNNKNIGNLFVNEYKCYKLIGKAEFGWNKLRVRVEGEKGYVFYLDKISLRTENDLILLKIPPAKIKSLKSNFYLEYLVEPVDIPYLINKKLQPLKEYIFKLKNEDFANRIIHIIGYSKFPGGKLIVNFNNVSNKIPLKNPAQNIYKISIPISSKENILRIKYKSSSKNEYFFLNGLIIEKKESEMKISRLAKIKNLHLIEDSGIGENPFGIKKKLLMPNYTKKINRFTPDNAINCIFAPPYTELEFGLKIPENCYLEFGYGILKESWEEESNGVIFKIILEEKNNGRRVIFSRIVNPYEKKTHRKIFYAKKNLSNYRNKKVKLKFITSLPSRNNKLSLLSEQYAFWFNPIIYTSINRKNINIILISIDTLRADHLGCYGYERKTSPTIDKLAKDGVVFLNAFSTTSWTLPAHISLLTSLENRNHMVNKANSYLNPSIITIADILRKKGYLTYAFTGGGLVSQRFGFSKGFDFYRDYKGSKLFKKSSAILYRAFEQFINKNKDKKFFLFLHTYQTHDPYGPPMPFARKFLKKEFKWTNVEMQEIIFDKNGKFKNLTTQEKENIISLYDGEIRYMDECLIKPMIKELKKLNLYNNTMIIFTSDHGEEFFDHKSWLHGHSLYNELIKIPLIIKFPFSKYKNLKVNKIVRITDIVPTILDVLNINYKKQNFDGKSLVKILKNEKMDRIFIADLGYKKYPFELPSRIAINFN